MLNTLQTHRTPVFAAIEGFLRGPSTRLSSSARLGWNSVHLENHRAPRIEKSETVSPHHIIALFTSHVSRGEIAAGRGRYVPYSFSPGAMNLFPAGPICGCRSFTDTTVTVCALDHNFVAEVGEELDRPSTGEFRWIINLSDHSLESIVTLLATEANSGGSSGRLYADHLAHALALRFLQLSAGTQVTGPSRSGKMPGRVLRRVLDRMKAEFATHLDLKTIAAESGYSRTHFLRIFRTSVGYSPHQWLTRLRIEESKIRLQKKANSLIDIALDCGFSSHGHFTSTFRKIVGVTPREYRRDFGLIL